MSGQLLQYVIVARALIDCAIVGTVYFPFLLAGKSSKKVRKVIEKSSKKTIWRAKKIWGGEFFFWSEKVRKMFEKSSKNVRNKFEFFSKKFEKCSKKVQFFFEKSSKNVRKKLEYFSENVRKTF